MSKPAMSKPAQLELAAVAERLEHVRERIESAGGDRHAVQIVAVTKGFDLSAVEIAASLGLSAIGENYVDELVAKAESYLETERENPVSWHFLGAIQRNKLRLLAPHVARYESVDRLEEGIDIARRSPGARVLIEVNTTDNDARGGVLPGEVAALFSKLSALDLVVEGLMAIGPHGEDEETCRAAFASVFRIATSLGLPEVSMGMSDDLELAVSEGATSVRIGRALFGPRPTSPLVSE